MPLGSLSKVILELPALSYIKKNATWSRNRKLCAGFLFLQMCMQYSSVVFRMEVVATDTFFYDEMAYS
jgi:hypothetical protein